MTTLELFRQLAPDIPVSVVSDARVEIYLELVGQRLSAEEFGVLFEQAVIYYAAHLLQLAPDGGSGGIGGGGLSGGAITSKKTGDEAIGFGSAATSVSVPVTLGDADLLQTHYGRQYLAIRDSRAATAPSWVGIV